MIFSFNTGVSILETVFLLLEFHTKAECDLFRDLKLTKGISPMTMVQNVGSLIVLRALLKKNADPQRWAEFMQLEKHLEERKNSDVWQYCEKTVKVNKENLKIILDIVNYLSDIPISHDAFFSVHRIPWSA